MDETTPPRAKSISRGIRRVPFGISALDGRFEGIPTGSAVMLAGAPDAGADAYAQTSIAELMLAKHRPELQQRDASQQRPHIPESVTYISLTNDREHVYHQLDSVLDEYQFETLVEHLTVADFSQQFLEAMPVPGPLADAGRPDTSPETDVEATADPRTVEDALDAVSELLTEVGPDSVVVIDSLSDLFRASRFGLDRGTVLAFLLALREAVAGWDGLAYVMYDRQASQVRADAEVAGLLHGNLYFYANDKGFETYRTMRVGSFGGALDAETQQVYETFVGPTGMRAKATQKIAPSNW